MIALAPQGSNKLMDEEAAILRTGISPTNIISIFVEEKESRHIQKLRQNISHLAKKE